MRSIAVVSARSGEAEIAGGRNEETFEQFGVRRLHYVCVKEWTQVSSHEERTFSRDDFHAGF